MEPDWIMKKIEDEWLESSKGAKNRQVVTPAFFKKQLHICLVYSILALTTDAICSISIV
jgi:hypothetical protein